MLTIYFFFLCLCRLYVNRSRAGGRSSIEFSETAVPDVVDSGDRRSHRPRLDDPAERSRRVIFIPNLLTPFARLDFISVLHYYIPIDPTVPIAIHFLLDSRHHFLSHIHSILVFSHSPSSISFSWRDIPFFFFFYFIFICWPRAP